MRSSFNPSTKGVKMFIAIIIPQEGFVHCTNIKFLNILIIMGQGRKHEWVCLSSGP